MTLHEYLQSEQAREDVRRLIGGRDDCVVWGEDVALTLGAESEGGFRMVSVLHGQTNEEFPRVYYRPDGDRYIVTDLGDGVRALRLRTGAVHVSQRLLSEVLTGIPTFGVIARGDVLCKETVKDALLPDAICRVMIASLMVRGQALRCVRQARKESP